MVAELLTKFFDLQKSQVRWFCCCCCCCCCRRRRRRRRRRKTSPLVRIISRMNLIQNTHAASKRRALTLSFQLSLVFPLFQELTLLLL